MMKKAIYVLAAFMVLFAWNLKAQVDSSFRTTYYEQKVSQYRIFKPVGKKCIMFVGDSITDIGEWNELLNTDIILNRGISSDNTFGVLHRLDDIAIRKPLKVFIMVGINDISNNVPDSIVIRNYRRIIDRIARNSPGSRIYVQSILPTNNEFTEFQRHQNKDKHIRKINEALKKDAERGLFTFIDLYPLFLNPEGKLDRLYTNDGLHLNAEGYNLWCRFLRDKGYF